MVELTNSVQAGVVFAPRLIIIACILTERTEDALEIVVVFKANVLFDNGDASGLPVFRTRCIFHVQPSV